MQRELALGGGFVAVLLAATLVAVLVPGVVADQSDDVRRGFVELRDMNVGHGVVGGSSVDLQVEARLQHRGGPTENVTVRFQAVSTQSGLVETTKTVDVGTVDGEREVAVPVNLSVERAGGYRIQAIVYQDGQRRSGGQTTVEGIETLTPAYAETDVEFQQFGTDTDTGLPVIEYSIRQTSNSTTTMNVSSYLTNTGDTPSEDLRLVLKARQADSNILAAEQSITVGQIDPGRTATPSTTLTVPSQYNYYLDAVLWKDGVVVGTARSAANLDPTETLSVNRTRRTIGLNVEDFQRGTNGESGRPEPGDSVETTTSTGPGFGLPAAIAALLAIAFLFTRDGDTR